MHRGQLWVKDKNHHPLMAQFHSYNREMGKLGIEGHRAFPGLG